MEVNKDEAERCIEVAEKFVLEGKFDRAEKFLGKAEKLYPTQKAKGRPKYIQNVGKTNFYSKLGCVYCLLLIASLCFDKSWSATYCLRGA